MKATLGNPVRGEAIKYQLKLRFLSAARNSDFELSIAPPLLHLTKQYSRESQNITIWVRNQIHTIECSEDHRRISKQKVSQNGKLGESTHRK